MAFIRLMRDPVGCATIWAPPVEGALYVAGVDPTLAREHTKASDHACISVWRRHPNMMEQVAEVYERLQPNECGKVTARLGRWYNDSLVNVERNIAEGVILGLQSEEYPEECWYFHKILKSVTGGMEERLFFNKTHASEAELFETFIDMADSGGVQLRSKELFDEMQGLRETKTRTGRSHVETNGKDRSIAALMAAIAHKNWPFNPPDISPDVPDENPPRGVDPNAWREKRGIESPREEEWGDLAGPPGIGVG